MKYPIFQAKNDLFLPIREAARFAAAWVRACDIGDFTPPLFRTIGAANEIFAEAKLTHHRPDFDIPTVRVGNRTVTVTEESADDTPFGTLLHFRKDIGISQFGATTDFITRYVLKQAGMEARRDADIIPMGTQANNLAALQAGTIHAAVLAPPTTLKAKKLGFNPVADMADYDLLFYTSALLAKRSWVAAHPGDALNVVRGYVAGVAMVHNNRQAAEAALGKYSDTSDKELLDASYEALVKVLPRNPVPQAAALQTGLDENANPAAKTADPKSFIDASFLARLQREGFIDALYKGAE